jgi:hypothetical protein
MRLGSAASPTFTGVTITGLTASRLIWSNASKTLASKDLVDLIAGTANQIITTDDTVGGVILSLPSALAIPGKLTAGSFASPTDVTATRQYGLELHYSGNDYDVTGIRSRARLKTTDTTATAQGALLQAANEDGINAGVLQGALIEAIGKSDANAATIAVMRGCLINTEWGDYDTVTNLKTLHVRTHSRNAADAGSFGTGYGIYIENEAVGGNGQAWDAGIYFKGTNLSAGNKAFTYGIDFSGGTYGSADIKLSSGSVINDANGRWGIGTTVPKAVLDVIGANNFINILMADETTDATPKEGRMGIYHYTNSEEPSAIFYAASNNGVNILSLGGGTSLMNAVEQIRFYTALNDTTVVGIRRMTIDRIGNVGINEVLPETLLELSHATPTITGHCITHTNSADARAVTFQAFGEQSGGEETTLGKLVFAHDSSADDEKAYLKVFINTGSDGDTPTQAVKVGSDLLATFSGGLLINDTVNVGSLLNSFNGIFVEKLDFTISEAGGTVTGSLEQDGTGDLTQVFSDGFTTLDCTPAKTIDLTAYVGTNAVPKLVFVYILQSNKTTLVASNSDWPATEHNKIARLLLKSAVTTGSDGGALVNQNWNDYTSDATGEGHILDIEHRLRQEPAQYEDGLALTLKNSAGAALTTGNSSTAVELVTTEGRVFQLHLHTFSAFDMYSVGADFAQIANQVVDEGGAYVTTADLVTDITRYVDGSDAGAAIGVNKYFNLVIWGVMNREGEASHIMINLPTGRYTTSGNAVADIDGTSTFDIPFAFKGTGFLIARLTFRLIAGAQWTYVAVEDLRGQTPVVSAGVGITTTDHALLANLAFASAGHTGFQAQGDVLDDLNTLGAVEADSEFLVGTDAGVLQWESGIEAMASMGETARTINLLASDNTAAKQAKIDATGKYIPYGVSIIFQFETGETHTETDQLLFSGFFGGGSISIQGNIAEANATDLHTTQDTIIDVTAQTNIYCLYLLNNSLRLTVKNLKIMLPDSTLSVGVYFRGGSHYAGALYNYIYAAGIINDTRGVEFRNCSLGFLTKNYFSSLKYGMISIHTNVFAVNNDDTGIAPLYGYWSDDSSSIGISGTKPNGSTADEKLSDGSLIIPRSHIVDAPGDTTANNATTINAILIALEEAGILKTS